MYINSKIGAKKSTGSSRNASYRRKLSHTVPVAYTPWGAASRRRVDEVCKKSPRSLRDLAGRSSARAAFFLYGGSINCDQTSRWHVLGPRARYGRPLDRVRSLSMTSSRAVGPARAQAIISGQFTGGVVPIWVAASRDLPRTPSSHHDLRACQTSLCFSPRCRLPALPQKLLSFGLGFGLSEGGSLLSGVGGIAASRSLHFVLSIAVPSRPPDRSGSLRSTDLQSSLSLSLSRPPRQ